MNETELSLYPSLMDPGMAANLNYLNEFYKTFLIQQGKTPGGNFYPAFGTKLSGKKVYKKFLEYLVENISPGMEDLKIERKIVFLIHDKYMTMACPWLKLALCHLSGTLGFGKLKEPELSNFKALRHGTDMRGEDFVEWELVEAGLFPFILIPIFVTPHAPNGHRPSVFDWSSEENQHKISKVFRPIVLSFVKAREEQPIKSADIYPLTQRSRDYKELDKQLNGHKVLSYYLSSEEESYYHRSLKVLTGSFRRFVTAILAATDKPNCVENVANYLHKFAPFNTVGMTLARIERNIAYQRIFAKLSIDMKNQVDLVEQYKLQLTGQDNLEEMPTIPHISPDDGKIISYKAYAHAFDGGQLNLNRGKETEVLDPEVEARLRAYDKVLLSIYALKNRSIYRLPDTGVVRRFIENDYSNLYRLNKRTKVEKIPRRFNDVDFLGIGKALTFFPTKNLGRYTIWSSNTATNFKELADTARNLVCSTSPEILARMQKDYEVITSAEQFEKMLKSYSDIEVFSTDHHEFTWGRFYGTADPDTFQQVVSGDPDILMIDNEPGFYDLGLGADTYRNRLLLVCRGPRNGQKNAPDVSSPTYYLKMLCRNEVRIPVIKLHKDREVKGISRELAEEYMNTFSVLDPKYSATVQQGLCFKIDPSGVAPRLFFVCSDSLPDPLNLENSISIGTKVYCVAVQA